MFEAGGGTLDCKGDCRGGCGDVCCATNRAKVNVSPVAAIKRIRRNMVFSIRATLVGSRLQAHLSASSTWHSDTRAGDHLPEAADFARLKCNVSAFLSDQTGRISPSIFSPAPATAKRHSWQTCEWRSVNAQAQLRDRGWRLRCGSVAACAAPPIPCSSSSLMYVTLTQAWAISSTVLSP